MLCLLCGRSPTQWHHVTGRSAPDAPYLDAALTIPLCLGCHSREHTVLRALGLEWPKGNEERDRLRHRLLRVGVHVRRCADMGRPFTVSAPSAFALGFVMLDAVNALSECEVRR